MLNAVNAVNVKLVQGNGNIYDKLCKSANMHIQVCKCASVEQGIQVKY